MTTPTKSKANDYLNSILEAVSAQREKNNAVVDDKRIEQAQTYKGALKSINMSENTAGQARLIAMWWLYNHVELVGEYNDFIEFVKTEILVSEGIDSEAVTRAANVTTQILQWVHANKVMLGDKRVTVDQLLHTEGLVYKLVSSVGTFIRANDSQRARIVKAILTMRQTELAAENKAILREVKGISSDGGAGSDEDPMGDTDVDGYTTTLQPVNVKFIRLSNDTVRMIFPEAMPSETAAAIELLLDGIINVEMAEAGE